VKIDPKVETMQARRTSIKHRRRDRKPSPQPPAGGVQLDLVLRAIETERDNLSRAEALLGCLKIAMEYGERSYKGPYYPDVAEIARLMVRKSISALDPINLPSPSRYRVKEAFSPQNCPPASLHEMPLLPRPISVFARPRLPFLHRRNYSRFSPRDASSMDSASVNISV
jgi:hypothetical protein